MFLTDNETKTDLLNNEAIARSIVALLREKPDHPVTIGVHGDWGAGKSSILEMIEAGMMGHERALCLKFNGWRFQGFEDAKIALIEGIVTGLVQNRSLLTKAGETVKEVLKRIDWLKVARHAGGLAVTAMTGLPTPDQIGAIVHSLKNLASDPSKRATKENYDGVIDSVEALLKPASSKHVPEEVEEFRKAFDDLLKKAEVDQLVVLIDDLDRCLPDTAIETLEAVRLFVFTSNTAFIVAADEAMIEYSVRKHFPDLPDTTGPRDYARNYLEKLIQIPFRIPPLGEAETRIYVTLLLVGAELGDGDPGFVKLIEAARELLRKPWTNAGLDAVTVKAALGERAASVQNALILSDQIGPLLASGTQGNPRQIKRFLNALLLRQQIAHSRGFGDEISLPVLAKLMLAERFIPRLFDQIATAAARDPDGTCDDLTAIENGDDASPTREGGRRRRDAPKTRSTDKDKKPSAAGRAEPESELIFEWKASEAIADWAKLTPPLAGIDLRPYLFVTKDRKDYFGATSVLGRLASVVEKLLGPKLAVQALEPELKQLAPAEAGQVFEALRSRIMSSDSFETAPGGIDGMGVLVRAHASLQGNLIDMLEALPAARCGPWPAQGWTGVITTTDLKARLEALLKRWANAEGTSVLKTTAAAALRTQAKGGR